MYTLRRFETKNKIRVVHMGERSLFIHRIKQYGIKKHRAAWSDVNSRRQSYFHLSVWRRTERMLDTGSCKAEK